MRKILKNQKGIALLIVLSTLSLLTFALVEFTYNSRVNYRIAANYKKQVQAYYLAKSALNFSKLILKYQKDAEKQLEQVSKSLGNMQVEPIYRMFPLSSELLRGALSGAFSLPGLNPESDTEGEESSDSNESDTKSDIEAGVGMIDKEKASEFLDFDGDFNAEIFEETIKFDLNVIQTIDPKSKSYDSRKKLLYSILQLPEFEDYFEDFNEEAPELVHALSDWVDINGVIDEFDNLQRGNEDSLYSKYDYSIKNSKFSTYSEIRLVEGMNDKLFKALKPYLTVYSNNDKINVCLAEDEILKALLFHYTNYSNCTRPIRYEEEDKIEELLEIMRASCPDPDEIALQLNTFLGLVDLEETSGTNKKQKSPGSQIPGCLFQFKDFITKDNKVFRIKASGVVDETLLTINAVINTDSSDPNKWKFLYYRVE